MKLTVEAFRGVNERVALKFNSRSNITIIYGENGSGKTTLSDALEFLFHGNPGSLEEKSLDGAARIPSLTHSLRNKSDLFVNWKDGEEQRTATLKGTRPLYEGEITTQLRTLRRDLVARLIDETPANRFKRIQDFVTIPALEQEETRLSFLIKEKETKRKEQLTNLARDKAELKAIYDDALRINQDLPDMFDWVQTILHEKQDTQNENLIILRNLCDEIYRLREGIKMLGVSYTTLAENVKNLEAEQKKLEHIAAENAGQLSDSLKLLQETQIFLKDRNDVSACPVCDTPQISEELQAKIDQKLKSLSKLSAQDQLTSAARKKHETQSTVLKTQQGNTYQIIEQLCAAYDVVVGSEQWQIQELIPSLRVPAKPSDLTKIWHESLVAEAPMLKSLREWLEQQIETIQHNINLKARVGHLTKAITAANKNKTESLVHIHQAKIILEIFRSERTKYANQTLADISDDFARLYSSIHPGEDLEKIRFYLHDDKKGSALLDGNIHGKQSASPVAYLSESHLDTLGFCLFIALQKKNNPANTILYIDDAIASVDEAHMERLYEMIVSEAANFKHVVITSHYQPLRFKFRWGRLTTQKVDFVELGSWSLDRGISLNRGPTSEIALFKHYLTEQKDAQIIAAKAGIVLERILDFLTGIYHCKLPRHPGAEQRWTLADYRSGLSHNKKLLANLECHHVDEEGSITQTITLAPLLDEIFSQLEMRNTLGAHYKEIAGQFNDLTEATNLGKATLNLINALCDENNQLPESNRNGRCWANKGKHKTRHLYPLLQPQ